jgi:tetratricopeptide (TPR) repeat protein
MNPRGLGLLFLVFSALFLLPSLALSGQIVLDSEKQLAFAQHYVEREEYDRAAQELERFVYFFPEDARVPAVHCRVGWCYMKMNRYERARKILWEVHDTYRLHPVAARSLFLIGESYRQQEVPEEAAYYFERILAVYPESEAADEARYRLGWARMEAGRWRDASKTFAQIPESSPLRDRALTLSEMSLHGEELPAKSPWTAGVLAGVLPGLGHAYCGRYQDATVALVMNGLFTWATIEAFDRDQKALGGLLGFMELGWYTGNIYSAANCAHRSNRKTREDFLNALPGRLGAFSSGDDVGLAFRFSF